MDKEKATEKAEKFGGEAYKSGFGQAPGACPDFNEWFFGLGLAIGEGKEILSGFVSGWHTACDADLAN